MSKMNILSPELALNISTDSADEPCFLFNFAQTYFPSG